MRGVYKYTYISVYSQLAFQKTSKQALVGRGSRDISRWAAVVIDLLQSHRDYKLVRSRVKCSRVKTRFKVDLTRLNDVSIGFY